MEGPKTWNWGSMEFALFLRSKSAGTHMAEHNVNASILCLAFWKAETVHSMEDYLVQGSFIRSLRIQEIRPFLIGSNSAGFTLYHCSRLGIGCTNLPLPNVGRSWKVAGHMKRFSGGRHPSQFALSIFLSYVVL